MIYQRQFATGILACCTLLSGQTMAMDLKSQLEPNLDKVETQVIAWRRDIHAHPELSNREFRTADLVAKHLHRLGLEVKTNVAHTGVVGILRGGKRGPTVALRGDMDALPITEQTGLSFASKVTTIYNGEETGVMHACGHDAHTAMLMGVAAVLAPLKDELSGNIMFVFQPAEEGPPKGEEGGAPLMIKEGLLSGPNKPSAIFAVHTLPLPIGKLYVRPAGTLASADGLEITITGKQTHAASPWNGIDPVTISAQIILALQTIPSRQLELTKAPAIVSIGKLQGGNRGNIIPDQVHMEGTIRALDPGMRLEMHKRIKHTAEKIAESAGAKADVNILIDVPVTYNDPALTEKMKPSLEWAAGKDNVETIPPMTFAEDFSHFQEQIPGMYFFIGVNKAGVGPWNAAANHSPEFYVNEDALILGVKAMAALAIDYLNLD